MLQECTPDHIDGLINFSKVQILGQIIIELRNMRAVPFHHLPSDASWKYFTSLRGLPPEQMEEVLASTSKQ